MQDSKLTTRIAAIWPCSFVIAGLASSPCWAHPGHGAGGGDWSALHYLTEPDHLVTALVLAVIIAAVRRAIHARRASQAR